MGTAFTIDSALRIARFGMSTVVSLVDDILIEQMREYYCGQLGQEFVPIKDRRQRAERITAYLDQIDAEVARQVEELRQQPFEPGSDIVRYFELLPPSPLKERYEAFVAGDRDLEPELRSAVRAGRINTNIMTKIDRLIYKVGHEPPPEESDALTALRGFANSTLRGGIVFSAGMNQRLYSYAAQFEGFFPDVDGNFDKQIILKVSDFRSAEIQGKFLAKRGLWVNEFRIESGLNCGGHAFPPDGKLMGPILESFKDGRERLRDKLFSIYSRSLEKLGRVVPAEAPYSRVTMQGGIGTGAENALLRDRYGIDGTGWATPFLTVPEVTRLDSKSRALVIKARAKDVELSNSSPLGIRYWNLMTSMSEDVRRGRLENGKPGSACPKGYLAADMTYTDVPICHASRAFQRRQEDERAYDKTCICHDLAGGATLDLGLDPNATPAVCPGPNVVNFRRVATLDQMLDHIYGRTQIEVPSDRPHQLMREAELSIDYYEELLDEDPPTKGYKELVKMRGNIEAGLAYYHGIVEDLPESSRAPWLTFLAGLEHRFSLLRTPAEPAAV